ncbi:MAG TPA: hypothetical protein VFF88_01755 [Methylocella sp.]|nr:hypothetical protein [Methylocella sp.]
MSLIDRLLPALLWLLGVLTVAGITHIAAIFALPKILMKDPYAQIAMTAKPAEFTLLPLSGSASPAIPFADPALVQAVCPYDLTQGALRLHADTGGDRLLTLSFRTAEGEVFYSMTDLAAQQGKMDLVVLTAAQLDAAEANDDEDNPSPELRLVAPQKKGMVIAGALALYPGERGEAEERIKSVSCMAEPVPQE